ncbi:hypothetical protein [Nocardia sp. NPDC052566]|uniref:hypothetical protein n=1 Tax=Nocardia sp. NPDC052566 TaxID=3364330 RepID=UPI0037C8D499
MSSPRGPMPGTVQALVILLYVGGIYVALYGLSQGGPYLAVQLVHGLLYVGLAVFVQLGKSWARTVLLFLCAIGAMRGVLALSDGVFAGLWLLVAPALYLILLNTHAARVWFHRASRQVTEEQ